MNQRNILGISILLIVAISTAVFSMFDFQVLQRPTRASLPEAEVTIFYGGEKRAFLQNPEIQKIFEERYRLKLDAKKAGSIAMATTLDTGIADCIWPSNQVAVELSKQSGKPVKGEETIFNSPIVFYAWAEVAEALEKAGIVKQNSNGFYTADVIKLGQLIEQGASWKNDLGVNVYGSVKVFSTNPIKSNSGNIWAALLATIFNGGNTPTEQDLAELLPKIERYFKSMGYMEGSSGDIFAHFLKQGMGARPIIVGYENQMIEFLIENAQASKLIKEKVRIIYAEPTIFASHPLISLTDNCERFQRALLDLEVQQIAWSQHAFRTGLLGIENNPADIKVTSLPENVSLVAPMPSAKVMTAIIESLN